MIFIMLNQRRKKTHNLLNLNGSSFKQIQIIQGCIVSNYVDIGPAVWRIRILRFVNVLSTFIKGAAADAEETL